MKKSDFAPPLLFLSLIDAFLSCVSKLDILECLPISICQLYSQFKASKLQIYNTLRVYLFCSISTTTAQILTLFNSFSVLLALASLRDFSQFFLFA